MRRFLGTTAKIILAVAGLSVILVGTVIVAVNVSPRPFAWYVKERFKTGVGVEPVTPPMFSELSRNVRAEKDIEYPSRFGRNRIDVFSPKDSTGPLPTIVWVHGGGFVGGDKAGIETWATMMASRGYTVISINYELAPQSPYPGPVIQLGEVYEFLKRNLARFPTVDIHRLIIGGDSAGAQIASQFAALQSNAALARSMQVDAVVPKEDVLAVILYCGPYDLKGLYNAERWFTRFFVRQIGWSYFNLRDWGDSQQAAEASTVENVTPDYPPSFITDGNSGSFERDARKLEAGLRENGVYVHSLYYPAGHGTIGHEYQFDFSIPESMECYSQTLTFLEMITTGK